MKRESLTVLLAALTLGSAAHGNEYLLNGKSVKGADAYQQLRAINVEELRSYLRPEVTDMIVDFQHELNAEDFQGQGPVANALAAAAVGGAVGAVVGKVVEKVWDHFAKESRINRPAFVLPIDYFNPISGNQQGSYQHLVNDAYTGSDALGIIAPCKTLPCNDHFALLRQAVVGRVGMPMGMNHRLDNPLPIKIGPVHVQKASFGVNR